MEGLKVSDVDLTVYVHPSKANKVSQAILRELSSLLFKFNETFDGVVLAYDANVQSKKAKILPGVHPYFGVKLTAKLLLFHPRPDMLLEEDIREEFKYKVKRGQEVFVSTSHKQHKIKVGTILRFLVKSFNEEILHISGSLLPAHTGSVKWLTKTTDEWSHAVRTSTKQKISEGRQEMQKHEKPMVDVATFLNTDRKHKKSKRQRSEDS
ncbi:uncharacterized protein LOC127814011 isoform X2 [Diospyros lotus]|uniref:uncharacterized protein LOC127814011 isoform X2 n=1 Tax=Diospyros lotus TaxID=55363 RepID=UPI00225205C5|nr:uncharacterized protein LOC127814011 isoform X2 [Diospyros lotus]